MPRREVDLADVIESVHRPAHSRGGGHGVLLTSRDAAAGREGRRTYGWQTTAEC